MGEVTVGKSDTDTENSSAVAIQKMMKSIILVSLAVLALSSATTISIENGQVCGLNVEACSTKPVPSAGVPVNKLEENEDFQVLAYYSSAVATFIVTNLDQEDILTHILVQQTKPEQFVDYIDPIYQLDETAHVILSAIREMVPVD